MRRAWCIELGHGCWGALNRQRAGVPALPIEWMIDLPYPSAAGSGIAGAALWQRMREATRTGRPAAGEEFVKRLDVERKRHLRPQKRGPKAKAALTSDR